MSTITPQNLIEQLNWRYATKQFDPHRKIDPSTWAALEEALVLAPSSFGLQPWKFVVVKDPVVREKLVSASWGQRQISDASHLVVFAIKKGLGEADIEQYLQRIATVRGVPRESLEGFHGMLTGTLKSKDAAEQVNWAARQSYIALGTLLTSAAVLGVDACPMEGIDPVQYDAILGLDQQGLSTVVVATVGYRAESDKYSALKKVRFAKSDVVLTV